MERNSASQPDHSSLKRFIITSWFAIGTITGAFAQQLASPVRLWSVGPLTQSQQVMGVAFGPRGAVFTGPHIDTQTQSVFSATRSIAFAGDRIVIASNIGTQKVEGAPVPGEVYRLLSLDARTGEVKDTRELTAFASLKVFATNDTHVVVAGRKVLRLTPDLKDAGEFDYASDGHVHGNVENISPDGSTLGNPTSPGFEFINAQTLAVTPLTSDPSLDASINNQGFVTNAVHWIRDYPKDLGFVTYTDAAGQHLLYHGNCTGGPQFLTNNLILILGCKKPLIIDTKGTVVRTLSTEDMPSYAGVSQNGMRFGLQTRASSGKTEQFTIYSTQTGEPIANVSPDQPGEEQSWSAFSPDGSMFVVGSPLKLTLYRLP